MLKDGQLKGQAFQPVADLFLNIKRESSLTTGSVYDLQAKWLQILAAKQQIFVI